MNTIRIRLGHESLDVTLAYLKGKDVESEEAQEHALMDEAGRPWQKAMESVLA